MTGDSEVMRTSKALGDINQPTGVQMVTLITPGNTDYPIWWTVVGVFGD